VSTYLEPEEHARAKASAAMRGAYLEDWIASAIREKLEREKRSDFSVVHSEE